MENLPKPKETALVIGGSDPSGGAGIQADIKALSSVGVHACSVITCITAQNTKQINRIFPLPIDVLDEQLKTIVDDVAPPVYKTGMLYNSSIIECVAQNIKRAGGAQKIALVLDPVMSATVGRSLVRDDYVESLKRELMPLAKIITPNLSEASVLSGRRVETVQDMKAAAKKIKAMGPKFVLVKGGHLSGDAVDVLYDGKTFSLFKSRRAAARLHGTGCTYASLIAGLLAKGNSIELAVSGAKGAITSAIASRYSIGEGLDILNIAAHFEECEDKSEEARALSAAVSVLERILPPSFVPEVGMNFVYAAPGAKTHAEVCGINGRIVRIRGSARRFGGIGFGASKHVAAIALTAMRHDKKMRSALNIAYSDERIARIKRTKLAVGAFDRAKEPKVAGKKVSTMEWGTNDAIKRLGKVPDVVYDKGGVGKEAMIRIIGKDPADVLVKLRLIMEQGQKSKR